MAISLRKAAGIVLLMLSLFLSLSTLGQVSINYPAPAQGLTRGLDQSVLTVQLGFNSSCASASVTVALPPAVSYVAGSVAKTGGSLAGAAIAESNISNLNAPVFSVTGITAAGDITFTITRTASCGLAASGKDTMKVTGSCGSTTENNASTNTYNLLSPALSITPPAAITGAFINNTYTRSLTVTNGGNGCTDTLRYFAVYPGGGIINTAAGNAITANGTSFNSTSSNGDTLFYKIYGATIFGGDNLLCNGETVNITENIKVVKCNVATAYGAGWGKAKAAQCQIATASSIVTMAAGVASAVTNITGGTNGVSQCTPGNKTWTIYNNGSGGNAGAMYNVSVAFNGGNTKVAMTNSMIGSASAAFTGLTINTSQFTADPDGAGGLEDLDGDGQYDDLAPGNSFTVTFNENWTCSSACPINYTLLYQAIASYTTMCGTAGSSANTFLASSFMNVNSSNSFAPSFIKGGEPFPVRFCLTTTSGVPAGVSYPTDSLYVKLTLPAGVAYVPGTATYNGASIAAGDAYTVGNILYIRKKSGIPVSMPSYNFCIEMNLVYTCQTTNGAITIPFAVYNVRNNSCACEEYLYCGTLTTTPSCPGASCSDGAANTTAAIDRKTFGWTDATLSTKVNPAGITTLSRATLLPFDTLELKQSAIGGNTTYANLHYAFQLAKAGGQPTVVPISGTVYFKRGAALFTCTLPAFDSSASTTALSIYQWDLTSLFNSCLTGISDIQSGDSMAVVMRCRVTNANNGLLYGNALTQAPLIGAYFYNLNASNIPVFCDAGPFAMYLVGLSTTSQQSQNSNSRGCIQTTNLSFQTKVTTAETTDLFPAEFRPQALIDSMAITWNPALYSYTATTTATLGGGAFWLNPYTMSMTANTNVAPIVNIPGKLVFANTGGTWPLSDIASPNYNSAYASIITNGWLPTCATPASTVFTLTTYYHNNYYTYPVVQPQTALPYATASKGYITASKPAITAQDNTGTVQGVLPQQYWDVQLTNASQSTAPFTWISFTKAAGSGISIDSVVLKPSNQVLTPLTYGAASTWYKVSDTGIPSAAIQQARVYFKYSNCQPDSTLFSAGWNCTSYPTDPTAAQCGASSSAYLKIIPQPSQIQLSIARQPGNGSSISLCTTDSVLVVVNSAQAGNLLSPSVNVYPPAGVTIQTPIQIEYPLGSGSYQNATTTSVSGGYKIDLTSHTSIGASGLPGTILNAGAAGRQAKLKVMFSTSCGITSGSPLTFEGNGVQPCGAAATGSGATVQTAGISITGASTTGSAGVTVGISNASLVCGGTATLTLSTTPVIAPTQIGDTVIYTIPAGLAYSGGFTGSGFGAVTTAPGAGGTTIVKVPLPAGVASGTAINYSFNVTAGGIGGCSSTAITASAKRDIAPLVCGGVPCTGSSVVIGSGASSNITIAKPSLSTGAFTYTEALGTPRTINYSFSISNSGTAAAAAGAYLIKIYCGGNNTGKVLATFTNNAVAAGTAITQTGSFTYLSPADCATGSAIFLQIQDTSAAGAKVCLCATPAGSSSAAHVLPVRLQSFTGAARGCNAALAWATAEEVNMSRFEVEQSTDNVHYKSIAVVTASRSSAGSNYAGLYSQPAGTAYYRLKMMSNDGTFTYSDVAPVRTACEGNTATAYPNPVTDLVTITGLVRNDIVRLTDVSGRLLLTLKAAGATEQADLSRYASGTYIIQVIRDGAIIQNIKIVKK